MSAVSDTQKAENSVGIVSGDTDARTTAQTEDSDVSIVQSTPRKLPAVETRSSGTSTEGIKRLETS